MKYHRLNINTDGTFETYNKVTNLLGVEPIKVSKSKQPDIDPYGTWTFAVDVNDDEEANYDFINNFLDLLEPNFVELEKLRIKKSDINFWLIYEYYNQCGMEFHPQEMARLGKSEIVLCIDCLETKLDKSTNR